MSSRLVWTETLIQNRGPISLVHGFNREHISSGIQTRVNVGSFLLEALNRTRMFHVTFRWHEPDQSDIKAPVSE